MRCDIHDFVTIEIDDEFPWKNTWRDSLSSVPGRTESSPSMPHMRLKLEYTRKLKTDGMIQIAEGAYASDKFLLDCKYGVRFGQPERDTLELLTDNSCLEWLIWSIQLALLQAGASCMHCAALARNGEAMIFAARGGVGKTMIAKLMVDEMDWEFMGDDYTIVTSDGMCYSFPQPMVLYPYHREYFPEVFSAGKGPPAPAFTNDLLSRMAIFLKPFLRIFPRLLHFARKHNPQSVRINPSEVFGKDKIARQAVIKNMVWLERTPGLDRIILERDIEKLVSRVFGSSYANFDPWCSWLATVAMSTGIIDVNDVYPKWLGILKNAFAGASLYTLRLPLETTTEEMREGIYNSIEQMAR